MVHPVIAMSGFFVDFVGRLAIMFPVILVLTAVLWLMFNRRRQSASAPAFSPSDMRTWSLRFALLDGAVFAITFAVLSTWMADSAFSVRVSGGLAAIVAMAVMPWVAARYPRLSNK
jgi:small-conductance mechanosensitive channel